MSVFTQEEISYLRNQRLARIVTVGPDGQPHVVPVGFRYNPDTNTIDIGGRNLAQGKKWRDVQQNPRVAVVIDDIASVNPWRVRGIEIRGEAKRVTGAGETAASGFNSGMLRITSKRIVSWGINPDLQLPTRRSVNMSTASP